MDHHLFGPSHSLSVLRRVSNNLCPTDMPYALGLQSAADAFLSAGFATHLTIAAVALFLILFISSAAAAQKDKDDAPVTLPGSSLLAIYSFFRQWYDFLNRGFRLTGQSVYQFQLLKVCSMYRCY
jgi:hypothetical protein